MTQLHIVFCQRDDWQCSKLPRIPLGRTAAPHRGLAAGGLQVPPVQAVPQERHSAVLAVLQWRVEPARGLGIMQIHGMTPNRILKTEHVHGTPED